MRTCVRECVVRCVVRCVVDSTQTLYFRGFWCVVRCVVRCVVDCNYHTLTRYKDGSIPHPFSFLKKPPRWYHQASYYTPSP